jgi:hypothetical protein
MQIHSVFHLAYTLGPRSTFWVVPLVFHLAYTLGPRSTFWVVPLLHVELIPHELTAR